jgi:hypothetical protein
MKNNDTLYVLCEDHHMTMTSKPTPTGELVRTEKEAKDWVAKGEQGFYNPREYYKAKIITFEG